MVLQRSEDKLHHQLTPVILERAFNARREPLASSTSHHLHSPLLLAQHCNSTTHSTTHSTNHFDLAKSRSSISLATMTMKRKRNELDSSPSSSSTSWSRCGSLSPSPSQHAFDFRFQSPWQEQVARPQFAWPGVDDERHNASGRTLKRFRDNRPDEQAIYGTRSLDVCSESFH